MKIFHLQESAKKVLDMIHFPKIRILSLESLGQAEKGSSATSLRTIFILR